MKLHPVFAAQSRIPEAGISSGIGGDEMLMCYYTPPGTSEPTSLGVSFPNVTYSNTMECYEMFNTLPETIVYSIYTLVVMLLGILGNTVVILATLKYTVFSLDSITMVFVRHLAIADIIYIVIRVLPSLVVHFGRGWMLGKGICYLSGQTVMISTVASMNFILVVSIHRLLRCMFPMRFSLSVRDKATVLALGVWLYSSIGTITSLALQIPVYFRPVISACDIDYISQPEIAIMGVFVQMMLPFFCIIILNISMYCIARKRFKDMASNHALMTVGSVSGLFVISWLPSILIIFLGLSKIPLEKLVWLDKLQINFYFLSVFGNPLIYSFVHKGFGRFARRKFSVFLRNCQNSVEAQWQSSSKSSDNYQKDSSHSAGYIAEQQQGAGCSTKSTAKDQPGTPVDCGVIREEAEEVDLPDSVADTK